MSNWKRTSEEMPPNDDTIVLFMTNYGDVYFGFYADEVNKWLEQALDTPSIDAKEVKAWCPIPEYDLND